MQLRDQIGNSDFANSNVYKEKGAVTAVAVSGNSRYVFYAIGDSLYRKEEDGFRANSPVQLCQVANAGSITEITVTPAGKRLILSTENAGLLLYALEDTPGPLE